MFSGTKITKRLKGQRRDKDLIPSNDGFGVGLFLGLPLPPGIASAEVVGETPGFTSSGSPCMYDVVVVTLTNGLQVPAYRHQPGPEGHDFCVCQDLTHKAG